MITYQKFLQETTQALGEGTKLNTFQCGVLVVQTQPLPLVLWTTGIDPKKASSIIFLFAEHTLQGKGPSK